MQIRRGGGRLERCVRLGGLFKHSCEAVTYWLYCIVRPFVLTLQLDLQTGYSAEIKEGEGVTVPRSWGMQMHKKNMIIGSFL